MCISSVHASNCRPLSCVNSNDRMSCLGLPPLCILCCTATHDLVGVYRKMTTRILTVNLGCRFLHSWGAASGIDQTSVLFIRASNCRPLSCVNDVNHMSCSVSPPAADSFTAGEQRAMMDSLRGATQNTMFEQWLGATMQPTLQPKQAVAPTQQVVRQCRHGE